MSYLRMSGPRNHVYKTKKWGPMTEPCGIPNLSCCGLEQSSPKNTQNVRHFKYDEIQVRAVSRISKVWLSRFNRSPSTVSNAVERSRSLFLCKAFIIIRFYTLSLLWNSFSADWRGSLESVHLTMVFDLVAHNLFHDLRHTIIVRHWAEREEILFFQKKWYNRLTELHCKSTFLKAHL